MIKKIKITREYKTIPKDFVLELGQMTVITGENNSGKTNFVKAVAGEAKVGRTLIKAEFLDEHDNALIPEIVYIAAENIKPSGDEAKFSNKTSGLIKNLSRLFSNLGRGFRLERQNEIIRDIRGLIEKASGNLKRFNGKDDHALEIALKEEGLDSVVIIQALISEVWGLENGVRREFDDLGQGTQRVIVASILKAYADILLEKNIITERPILILFEEPEIYLHPKLKRVLNATLEKIAEQDNHQVIITTHDPYFVFQSFEGGEKIMSSFKKEDNRTKSFKGVVYGIEDELLFMFLYSLLVERGESLSVEIDGFEKRKYFRNDGDGNKQEEDQDALTYIRHQIHHLGDNPYTIGLVSRKLEEYNDKNYYTEEELANAIRKMSEILTA